MKSDSEVGRRKEEEEEGEEEERKKKKMTVYKIVGLEGVEAEKIHNWTTDSKEAKRSQEEEHQRISIESDPLAAIRNTILTAV